MKHSLILAGLVCMTAFHITAQSLGRISLGTTHAQTHFPGISLSYSVGETVIGTASSPTLILTKGFQQADASSSSFPVEWLSLHVEQRKEDALLTWNTAWEENSDYFDIQRSLDAQQFETIGTVAAAGQSQDISTYQFLDLRITQLGSPSLYYRLRQVDLDGQQSFSPMISLALSREGDLTFSAYPNPTDGMLQVDLQIRESERATISLVDVQGKMLEKYEEIPSGSKTLDLSLYPRGIYILHIRTGAQQVSKRILLR